MANLYTEVAEIAAAEARIMEARGENAAAEAYRSLERDIRSKAAKE